MDQFRLDDEVTTKDGRKHRVLWATKIVNGLQVTLLCKRLDGKVGEKHKVETKSIAVHKRNGVEIITLAAPKRHVD